MLFEFSGTVDFVHFLNLVTDLVNDNFRAKL